jgi:mono/diheme cytochrome c family protein
VRDGALPHPDRIFELRAGSPGNYALRPGGDPARGKRIIAERCAGCHGADGTELTFDGGEFSLGSHARQKAYEDWLKIMNGQPGSTMGRQLRGASGEEMAKELLDILAALCDRAAFPRGAATGKDVADADPRCGVYLR